ncbi:MAG: transcriptional repressor [Sedimentisphaerales bacterium]|nr:transcriptional repressor [Sedimentisphaerales bacterium]
MDKQAQTLKIKDFERRCRQSGLKLTPQRFAVYRALINTDAHPTAEAIYQEVRKEMPAISLDTVNRTLLTLTEIGSAFIVEGTGQPRRFDGGLEDHQHFLCIKCGKVIDFHHPPFDNIQLPQEIEGKFKVLRKTVYLEGLCEACQKKDTL